MRNSLSCVDEFLELVEFLQEWGGILPGDAGGVDAGAELVHVCLEGGQGSIGAGGIYHGGGIGEVDRAVLQVPQGGGLLGGKL